MAPLTPQQARALMEKALHLSKADACEVNLNANSGGNIEGLANILFSRYVFAFEAAGLLLVVAAVGALVLGKRRP